MSSTHKFIVFGFLVAVFTTDLSGQEQNLLQPMKLDWGAIAKSVSESEEKAPKRKTVVSEKQEFERAKKATTTFLAENPKTSGASQIDGVWRSARGVYYVFDHGRSAQLLFLDIMSKDTPEGPPLVLDSTFALTKNSINFRPGTEDSRHIPFEISKNRKGEKVLKMNLNGDKQSKWHQVRFD